MNNAKKLRERLQWERLEISSIKLEVPREYFMKRWAWWKKKMVRTYEKQKRLRRGGKNTKNYTKKGFNNPDNRDGVGTTTTRYPGVWSHVGLKKHYYKQSYWKWWNSSWAISNPKWFTVKVLYSICQQVWKTRQGYRTRNVQFSIHPKEGQCQKSSNYCTIAFISHVSKVMLKIHEAWLKRYVNWEPADVQVGFRKGRGTRDQIPNIHLIIEKARKFQKNIYFCFLDYTKILCGLK